MNLNKVYRVVREGGLTTLIQIACIVIIGACVSNVVCLLLWPQTAARNLREQAKRTLGGFANLLALLTHTFLQEGGGQNSESHKKRMQQAAARHEAAFTGLQRALAEARAELASQGRTAWTRAKAYDDAVGCLQRLGQHLNGLRSGAYAGANVGVDGATKSDNKCKGKRRTYEDNNRDSSDNEIRIFEELVEELGPPLNSLSVSPSVSELTLFVLPSSTYF